MASSLAIGDFSRATHLNIKALRHYHRIGLLVPAEVDQHSGHRRYGTDQVSLGHVIRRFRALDMPLEEIHAVVTTGDPVARSHLIAAHLERLEASIAHTQEVAESLRDLLEPPHDGALAPVEHRRVPATSAAAVSGVIDVQDATDWYQGALGEIHALLAVQKVGPSGPGGAIYSNSLFTDARGEAIVFVPCDDAVRPTGRISLLVVPEVDLAVTEHRGPHTGQIDQAYGSLATYVAEHALGVEGPIREYYVVGAHETLHEEQWRTDVGWPIFHTG